MLRRQDIPILDDPGAIVRIIAKVTGQDEFTVAGRLLDEHREVGMNVRKAMDALGLAYHQWSEQLNEFYGSTDAFLFETVVWNRSPLKQEMRAWISESIGRRFDRPIRILSFGDGLGFDSLAFALEGHQVDYLEVSEKSKLFATELLSVTGVPVRILDGIGNIEEEDYDAILMLDVLEHVHEPEPCVAALAKALRPGGYFYTHSPFWLLTLAVPTHLAENQTYSGDLRRLFYPHGLRPMNARLMWNPIELQKRHRGSTHRPPLIACMRMWLGGYLLWWGRYWNAPHIAAVQYLFSRKQEEWNELESFMKLLNGSH